MPDPDKKNTLPPLGERVNELRGSVTGAPSIPTTEIGNRAKGIVGLDVEKRTIEGEYAAAEGTFVDLAAAFGNLYGVTKEEADTAVSSGTVDMKENLNQINAALTDFLDELYKKLESGGSLEEMSTLIATKFKELAGKTQVPESILAQIAVAVNPDNKDGTSLIDGNLKKEIEGWIGADRAVKFTGLLKAAKGMVMAAIARTRAPEEVKAKTSLRNATEGAIGKWASKTLLRKVVLMNKTDDVIAALKEEKDFITTDSVIEIGIGLKKVLLVVGGNNQVIAKGKAELQQHLDTGEKILSIIGWDSTKQMGYLNTLQKKGETVDQVHLRGLRRSDNTMQSFTLDANSIKSTFGVETKDGFTKQMGLYVTNLERES